MKATIGTVESSPQAYARLGGLLYVIIIILGISSEFFFRGRLVVGGNPAATAANIKASASLWRTGIVAEYLTIICTIVLAMIYFFLLRPVNRSLNLLATFFRIVSIIVQVVAVLKLIEALYYAEGAEYLKTFAPEQLSALTTLSIKGHSNGYGISLLFLGCCFLVHGYLITRSGFLPKVLGIFIQIAGVAYLANGFTLILAPGALKVVFPILFLPVFIAETSLGGWLLIKGINVEKWRALYAEAG